MKIVSLIQGTPEWHAHRASHFNASDAPAMLGLSPYKTRAQLIRELATGALPDIDEATQRRFDDGHRYEALARPLAEQIIGEELYPVVGVEGPYSASYDGLTLLGDAAFEHKSLNDTLRAAMFEGCTGADLPEIYQVQMEHQLLVSIETDRVLFMASKWDAEGNLMEERHCLYTANHELRARIVAGWAQLEADVAAYEPEAAAQPAAAGRAPDQMPALLIEVTGQVTQSNLAAWKEQAIAVFQGISTDLSTDQDFADAEKTVKWCGDIEDQLKGAKQHALSQTASIDELFRTIDAISEEARATRLRLDKLVKARKEERRSEIGNDARRAVQQHILGINETLDEHGLPMPSTLIPDIQAAMKGKKSFSSMQEAVSSVVANAKITASQTADRVRANMAVLAEHPEHASLFADRVRLVAEKATDDLRNLVLARINEHEQREAKRREDERAKMREEEEAKARKKLADEEAARVAAADAAAAAAAAPAPEPSSEPVVASQPAPAPAVRSVPTSPAPCPAAAAAPREVEKIKLGDINSIIHPMSVSADGLALLGFKPLNTTGAAKLYDAANFEAMCQAMVARLQDVSRSYPKAA
ncbi:lambda-exonuclease family protein [Stenotrophomonas sp. SORGH_AS_0321]|uniref:lambda-exonuclease family protein n=1 Tax=Stenotrophomonas sp. SORGH_AS_0321 TaxID=3041787 RepID=UPI0028570BC1|nr:YqaJ viral recombinase family protein [Stenotrophomonas sp. SORGH_AS_0321]MDR6094938.1 putative phage-type endonuclease [Stenotrophomonas sp. SORGH_AS_0321]